MHPHLARLDIVPLSGRLPTDMAAFLNQHGHPKTAGHCAQVGAEAGRLARQTGVDLERAAIAGYLHDISVVFPTEARAQIAADLGLPVLPEERAFPMIVHQKLSVVIARELFGIADEGVLSAIGCHTTLKGEPSPLDKVVFIADKIRWDQPGEPPYLVPLQAALEDSVDQAVRFFLSYLWRRRHTLHVIHPWLRDAVRSCC